MDKQEGHEDPYLLMKENMTNKEKIEILLRIYSRQADRSVEELSSQHKVHEKARKGKENMNGEFIL
jgi:hypothetical protein